MLHFVHFYCLNTQFIRFNYVRNVCNPNMIIATLVVEQLISVKGERPLGVILALQ